MVMGSYYYFTPILLSSPFLQTSFSDRFLSFSRIFCHFLPHFPSRQTIPVLFAAASPHFSQRFQSFERKRYWARTVLQPLFRV
ncbi:hypothetical protein P8452_51109 [Trifolium repens]|nr:hypothetical protein P8452_51109 [Trifolium repens]